MLTTVCCCLAMKKKEEKDNVASYYSLPRDRERETYNTTNGSFDNLTLALFYRVVSVC